MIGLLYYLYGTFEVIELKIQYIIKIKMNDPFK